LNDATKRTFLPDSDGPNSDISPTVPDPTGRGDATHPTVPLTNLANNETANGETDMRLQSLHRNFEELRRHAASLENDLNRIVTSTSWKATAPLRLFLEKHPASARVLRRALKLLWWTVSFQLLARLKQRRLSQSAPPRLEQTAFRGTPVQQRFPLLPEVAPDHAADAVLPARNSIEHNLARIQDVENRLNQLTSMASLERHRLDYALLAADGLLDEIGLYHEARNSPDYRRVFDEREPLVSICVATMNRSDLLVERCLQSLICQTYRNIQIVVVGDHCTDDTGSRVARLRDDRISFRNLTSRGPYPRPGIDRWRVAGTNAINTAMSISEGHFITHLDDDDHATADRIEALVNAAKEHKADFCWHPFWCENRDGGWYQLGDGRFELGQITTGSIFYHRYFKRIPWDVFAYRTQEPGDWNRLRKIRCLRPQLHFVDRPLLFHHVEGSQPPFVRFNGEQFLE
jgi:hypothetical protein